MWYEDERPSLIEYFSLMKPSYPKHDFSEYITESNKEYCSNDAIDLLTRMLAIDHVTILYYIDSLKESQQKMLLHIITLIKFGTIYDHVQLNE